jgi:gamma-glutamyltranspeptidase/glutathione hydrolase
MRGKNLLGRSHELSYFRLLTRSNRPWIMISTCVFVLTGLAFIPVRSHASAPVAQRQAIVATYHPIATQVGVQILQSGGNAFDAFVGATLAEYVLAEGVTSLAGSLAVLVYDAKSGNTNYLDAHFNDVKDAKGRWTADAPQPGKAVLVPGAVAGLEALSKRYGRLNFAEVLQPAIALARDGFKISDMYALLIAWRAEILKGSDYGRRTFFPDGQALQAGDVLRQPEVADFLTKVREQGSSYMYRGDWAMLCIEAVKAKGGLMTRDDLASYQPAWVEPWKTSYRGYEIYSSSGRAFGGLWALVALKTIEHTDITSLGHFSTSADPLEIVVRTARAVWGEPWIFDYRQLDNRKVVQSRLASKYTANIWAKVGAQLPVRPRAKGGSHSYHIIVIDKDGNVASGTNTHESTPWADGIFVEGIPLANAGSIPWSTRPGERRLAPFSIHLAFQDGRLRFTNGAFAPSIIEASFQFLLNLIDYKLSVNEAVSLPRFGTFPHDSGATQVETTLDWSSNWLDPRISAETVDTLKARGLSFQQKGLVDTGLGTIVVAHPDGTMEGATAPWPFFANPPGTVQTATLQVLPSLISRQIPSEAFKENLQQALRVPWISPLHQQTAVCDRPELECTRR